MKEIILRYSRQIIGLMLIATLVYFLGRAYFELTAGFSVDKIQGAPKVSITIDADMTQEVESALNQPFYYLGKGIQSYVFISKDRKFVLKFIKMQHFKAPFYLEFLSWIPSIKKYQEAKNDQKGKKLEPLLLSWKIAYEDLPRETAVVFVHLPKSQNFKGELHLVDKLGFAHQVSGSELMFLLQRSLAPIQKVISDLMATGKVQECEMLLDRLVGLLLSEYKRGFRDSDPTLLQNTGVLDNNPVHIDVGDFSKNEKFKDPAVYEKDLFDRSYRFRMWLARDYPELEKAFQKSLLKVIGPKMHAMKPDLQIIEEGD